jgi:cytochrome c peroxidase
MTVQKWELGRELFFDVALSTDSTVSCASCHNAKTAYVDNLPTSVGIGGKVGGMNAPTVINSAYNPLQFWDGRAASLEEQAQGPVTNPVEMFDPRGDKNADAWHQAVLRIRQNPQLHQALPERLRHAADPAMPSPRPSPPTNAPCWRPTRFTTGPSWPCVSGWPRRSPTSSSSPAQDYETVLKAALAEKDTASLEAIQFVPAKLSETAKRLANGHALFFGKARCNSCHVGDNFTDNEFHNLGVGVVDGQLQPNHYGRFVRLPTGHKRPDTIGAFKTPDAALAGHPPAPYMHDGSEKTLEDVVEFYDRGGNPNEFLDVKMRDFEAERAYLRDPKGYNGPKVYLFGEAQTPIVPLRLNLTPQEKADLVLFLRALQGRPVDPIVANPTMPIPR